MMEQQLVPPLAMKLVHRKVKQLVQLELWMVHKMANKLE
jgi:hypothetical protein